MSIGYLIYEVKLEIKRHAEKSWKFKEVKKTYLHVSFVLDKHSKI